MSVVNFNINRVSSYTEAIKSKEELIFHVGFRRYLAKPLFSDNSRSAKHKLEKYFHSTSRGAVASVIAPITYPPAPLVVFKQLENGLKFAASGSVLDVNPDRLIIKRIILTGKALKISRNRVVMHQMFNNPEDVKWFKPVQLWTKYGRVGHIKDPVGTHGKCKCYFDNPVGSQDTICMSLYKRVFPKWVTMNDVPRTEEALKSYKQNPSDPVDEEKMEEMS
eukprot:TRINITY_DN5610_c0_g1_i1.p1 TRINITY_DN5610_c0_g1~~TRINITY_DN5610_c0_g1_i1.p1  ORF type:complete len:221 (+),score=29.84 TRINITY_DN5610_c0_g1_i1:349-1011(+)